MSCAQCGANSVDRAFCDACGSSLEAGTRAIQLASGAAYVVDGLSIEIVRREPEGDWSARSSDGRYFLASLWPVTSRPDASQGSVPLEDTRTAKLVTPEGAVEPEADREPDAALEQETVKPEEHEPEAAFELEAIEETEGASPAKEVDAAAIELPAEEALQAPLELVAVKQEATEPEQEAAPEAAAQLEAAEPEEPVPDVAPSEASQLTTEDAAEPGPPLGNEAGDDTPAQLLSDSAYRHGALAPLMAVLDGSRHPSMPQSHLVGRLPDGSADVLFVEYDADGEWLPTLELSASDACKLGGQLAQGLSAIHSSGWALASLRPEAIRWSHRAERAQIARVDGALPVGEAASSRTWGIWTAPEVVAGDPVSPASDVFSLGSVLGGVLGIYRADEDGVPYWSQNPAIDPELAGVLMRCTTAEPSSRPSLQLLAKSLGELRTSVRPEWHAAKTVGRVRETQQDGWAALAVGGSTGQTSELLVLVADGMGGMAAGHIASSLAVRVFTQAFQAAAGDAPDTWLGTDAAESVGRRAFADATAAINAYAERHPESADLGTTLTGAYIAGTKAVLIHAGDSRCVLLRNGKLRQLTTDHTVAARLVEIGEITEEEAAVHPQGSTLYRSLNAGRAVEPEVITVDLEPGDRLMLSSDGVHGLLPTQTIAMHMTLPPVAAARALITDALLAGGHDNATAIVVYLDPTASRGTTDAAS